VKSPDEPSERQPIGDEPDAVVGELRRRHVVHRQDHASNELQDEEEEENTAGDEPPADARRQRFVEEMRFTGAEAGARVEPVEEGLQAQSCTIT
jgi:hypothetical protein